MEKDSKKPKILKIIVLGNSSVGKTSFINRYFDKLYDPKQVSTISIETRQNSYKKNPKYSVCVWDTVGQD